MSDWIQLPDSDDDNWATNPDNPLRNGVKVRPAHSRIDNPDRIGTVVGNARSVRAHEHWTQEHGDPVTCVYGSECDALCDNEGPLVRYDDQEVGDESLDWYPGQATGILEPVNW